MKWLKKDGWGGQQGQLGLASLHIPQEEPVGRMKGIKPRNLWDGSRAANEGLSRDGGSMQDRVGQAE